MNKIPKDDRLNTLALSELLKDTQNSYKHLLFGFLLKEIKTRTNIELFFTPSEIQRGALVPDHITSIILRLISLDLQ